MLVRRLVSYVKQAECPGHATDVFSVTVVSNVPSSRGQNRTVTLAESPGRIIVPNGVLGGTTVCHCGSPETESNRTGIDPVLCSTTVWSKQFFTWTVSKLVCFVTATDGCSMEM